MARKMWDKQPDKAVYRTVITKTYTADFHPYQSDGYVGGTAGHSYTTIYGPYSTRGAARAMRTSIIHQTMRTLAFRKGALNVTGRVERSSITWETVDEE